MSQRKRAHSSESSSHRSLNKRRRYSLAAGDSQATAFGSQGKLYKVRDIINEKGSKYLIDWEDDPETREKYQPTWEPKSYANAEAVAAWKRKQRKIRRSKSDRSTPSTASRATTVDTQTATESPPRVTRSRRRLIIDPSSSPIGNSQQSQKLTTQEVSSTADSQLSSPSGPATAKSGLAVEISPHSSLRSSQFIYYPVASSSQLQEYTEQDLLDSGIGESSPTPYHSPYVALDRNGTIPDSQSLPNSESYIFTNSRSSTGLDVSRAISQGSRIIGTTSSVRNRISSSADEETNDPIEASVPRRRSSRRLTSTSPRQSSPGVQRSKRESSNVPRRAHPLRIVSSPEDGLQHQLKTNDSELESYLFNHSTGNREAGQESSAFEPLTQGTRNRSPSRSDLRAIDSVISPERQLDSRENIVLSNESQDFGFQTQIPLALISQISEHSQGTQDSTGKFERETPLWPSSGLTEVLTAVGVWQSGQHIATVIPSGSQASSIGATDTYLTPREAFISGVDQLDATPCLPSNENEPLVDSENSSTAQTPILTQRDPNSQSGKTVQSAQVKEDILVTSIESPDFVAEDISTFLPGTAPSQLPEILDSNIPPRPTTPSDLDMSDELQTMAGPAPQSTPLRSMSTGPGLREKLKNMRAASAAEAAARKANLESSSFLRTSKSPSIIPEPVSQAGTGDSRLEVRKIEVPLPQRASQTNFHTPANPSKLHLHNETSQLPANTSLCVPRLGYMEFVVPLPAPSRVKDQYIELLDSYGTTIKRFHDDDTTDKGLTSTVQHMLDRLNNITTHIDLDNDTTMLQQDVTSSVQVTWAVDSSAKFQFLQQLIRCLYHKSVNIAVVAKGGRLLDLLETFLKGLRVEYYRVDTGARLEFVPDTTSSLMMTLIPSDYGVPLSMPVPVNLIVAFDTSIDQEIIEMHGVRTYHSSDGRMVPVVHLLVHCSAEHISRCLPPSSRGSSYLKMIVECVTRNREEIGKLLPEEYSPVAAADEVAAFVNAGGLERMWTLPRIRPVDIDIVASSQTTFSTTQLETQSPSNGSNATPGQHKRPIVSRVLNPYISAIEAYKNKNVSEDSSDSVKRQRLTPVQDITHISDSVAQSAQAASQVISDLQLDLKKTETELANLRTAHDVRVDELQATVESHKQQIQERMESLSELQRRYEERDAEYHALRHEKEDFIAAGVAAERKREALIAETSKLKEERKLLDEEIKRIREALGSSTIPQVAELESLRSQVRSLNQDKAMLERKTKSMAADFEFTRQQYQLASSSAVESATRVTELEAENAVLRQKASGEAMRLRQATLDHALESQSRENEKLAVENADLRELLRKKERGKGVTTRTGSVAPKSPRLGNSPARSRAGSRAPGSRPGSPVRSFLGVRKGRGPMD
ncbi:hypothetical protein MMC17_003860 [Xylographa soralifera]|nr:hypothetical protein [Xylographa soralifera]